jgi:spore germination cell wall hydrolase CwlJ-like protein
MKRRLRLAGAFCAAAGISILALHSSAAGVPVPSERPKNSIFRSYNKEIACLAKAIYFEARGEPLAGQQYVARVVLNRVDSAYYPSTICDVVHQNDHMKNACQFSFVCDGIPERISEPLAFGIALRIARRNFRCDKSCRDSAGPLSRSTHYHATSVAPYWADKLRRTGAVGQHVFYFTPTM